MNDTVILKYCNICNKPIESFKSFGIDWHWKHMFADDSINCPTASPLPLTIRYDELVIQPFSINHKNLVRAYVAYIIRGGDSSWERWLLLKDTVLLASEGIEAMKLNLQRFKLIYPYDPKRNLILRLLKAHDPVIAYIKTT